MEIGEDLKAEAASRREERNLLLKDIGPDVIRNAWFTLSHLLLPEGARAVHMGCDEGEMTYAMAVLNPKIKFIGIDKDKRVINKAKQTYERHNLEFKVGDVTSAIFDKESIDCIINSYILHEVYSDSRYNERIVTEVLDKQFKMLKKGGVMYIRDYAQPPSGEYVLIELPDQPSLGNDLKDMSDADLLIWFSEHARARQDSGFGGFFLEELPQRKPGTRLFRLPSKWAYEFIMRKDRRKRWEREMPMEYTFFTVREFRKQLSALGARVQYSAPQWEDEIIEERFAGRFRLFQDNGTPMAHPPTCFVAVSYKQGERKSLSIMERRPSNTEEGKLQISALRDQKTGQVVDVASRGLDACEILPYRVNEDGKLKIYMHDGLARSIANAVPRRGKNIDSKRWSGHMVEPVAIDHETMKNIGDPDIKSTVKFARDYLGLKPKAGELLEKGPHYYPAPDYIDEMIHTYYLAVEEHQKEIRPRMFIGSEDRFQAKGVIREMDAQEILNAINVGMIPNSRLELQILSLFKKIGLRVETWDSRKFNIEAGKISSNLKILGLLKQLRDSDKRFKEVKGTTGELRQVHSTFVEEGQSRGAVTGIAAQDVDFVVHSTQTINTVTVLPLTKSLKGDIHAGFLVKQLPVPDRRDGKGATISAPSFNLPPNIIDTPDIKKFIAEKFGLLPDMVVKMGPSYHSHIGMTPQRIHPYAVAAPPDMFKDPDTTFMAAFQIMMLWKHIKGEQHFMTLMARTYKYFNDDMKLEANILSKSLRDAQLQYQAPDWSIPLSYDIAPGARTTYIGTTAPQAAPQTPQIIQIPEPLAEHVVEAKASTEKTAETQIEIKQTQPMKSIKTNVEMAPDVFSHFQNEIEEVLDALAAVEMESPRPEKW